MTTFLDANSFWRYLVEPDTDENRMRNPTPSA
jgi:hypothetical protein